MTEVSKEELLKLRMRCEYLEKALMFLFTEYVKAHRCSIPTIYNKEDVESLAVKLKSIIDTGVY